MITDSKTGWQPDRYVMKIYIKLDLLLRLSSAQSKNPILERDKISSVLLSDLYGDYDLFVISLIRFSDNLVINIHLKFSFTSKESFRFRPCIYIFFFYCLYLEGFGVF